MDPAIFLRLRHRAGRQLVLGAVLAAGLVLAGGLSPTSGAARRSGERTPFIGISPQTPLHRDDLRLMRRIGVGSLRMPVFWSQAEPSPGAFDWTATDDFLISTLPYGFHVLPLVWGSPAWLPRTSPPPSCPFTAARCQALSLPVHSAAQRRSWSRFLRALVARYGPGGAFWELHPRLRRVPLRSWQIWNEENDHRFAEASVGAYARLLRVSAPAIHSIDPRAEIVLGGLYARPKVAPSIPAAAFLSRLYRRRGIRALFDAAALHPYAPNPRAMASAIAALRRVMRRHRDGRAGLYITEFGWGSQTRAAGGDAFEPGPRLQAEYLGRAWATLFANRRRWHLEGAFWFTWQDIPASSTRCDFCDSNGLLRLDGSHKPALRELARVAHRR
jgi:hypothetical protein